MKSLWLVIFMGWFNTTFAHYVYLTPPENYQPKIEVAACFMIVSGQVLFLHRLPDKSEGNTWGIPGGKLEKGETPFQAVVREIDEETGIDLNKYSVKSMGTVYIRYPEVDFTYHMFAVHLPKDPGLIQLNPKEHSEYLWLTLQEALELPLIRGEDECIQICYGEDL